MLKIQFPAACRRFMKRSSAVLPTIAAAVSLTGCITFLTEINVRGDGGGTMVQTITMNPGQIKESVESAAKQMGATMSELKEETKDKPAPAPAADPGEESDFKDKAVDLGQGVTFVSAEKIDTKTAAGVRVTYAFKDINLLAVNPKPEAAMGVAGAGASSKDALKFKFSQMPNGNAVLTVVLPGAGPEAPKEQTATPPSAASQEGQAAAPPEVSPGEPDLEMSMMAMQMFKGLRMGLAVTVEGKVVKTNSPYVEGPKVTLLDIDFDRLLADKEAFKAFNDKMGPSMGDDRKMMEALKGLEGLKITTGPEVYIEFTPDKNP
jgi:hypothetical protein